MLYGQMFIGFLGLAIWGEPKVSGRVFGRNRVKREMGMREIRSEAWGVEEIKSQSEERKTVGSALRRRISGSLRLWWGWV